MSVHDINTERVKPGAAAASARILRPGVRGVTVVEIYRAGATSRTTAGEATCS